MSRAGRDAWLLFAVLWLAYGATIDRADLFNYNLQQSVVEALVERGTYAVGGSAVPQLNDKGDAFLHDGRWLPSKQPGQPTLGAGIYFLCRWFGVTYRTHYFISAALVTWLTASLACAIAGACFHLLVTGPWGLPRWAGLASALAGGLCTTVFPYAGVAHHDAIAAALLLAAFYFLERSLAATEVDVGGGLWARGDSLLAGGLIGMTLFTSMLPAALAMGLLAYVLATRRRAVILPALGGMALGLAPLAVYNALHFGSPFVQANMAGNYTETFASFDLPRLAHHVNAYFGTGDVSVLKYMPILALSAAGLFLLPPRLRRRRVLLLAMIGLHLAYVLDLPFIGACQYGPRLLMPMIPFAMLGLPSLLVFLARRGRRAARLLLCLSGAVAVYSFIVSAAGALCGTMFCDTSRFAFLEDMAQLPRLRMQLYPLLGACLMLGVILAGALALRALSSRRRRPIASPASR